MTILWQRWAWRTAKALLAAAILVSVGRQFARDLSRPELHDLTWRPGWLALSAVLYLLFIGTSCWFWRRLLMIYGPAPSPFTAARAYYVSQLGKYVPGKAWALLVRGALVKGPGIGLGVAILTSFYEVLTSMTAGALTATVALTLTDLTQSFVEMELPAPPVFLALALVGICAAPLVPALFNRVVTRFVKDLPVAEGMPQPRIGITTLVQGIGAISCGWCLLGVSVWAGLAAVLPEPPPLEVGVWLRCVGAIGLAYVAGFVVLVAPSGLGVREFLLRGLLSPLAPTPLIAAGILLMRLAWTIADVAIAGALYFFARPHFAYTDEGGPQACKSPTSE
jgi:glycosyltransferase 2 family protein